MLLGEPGAFEKFRALADRGKLQNWSADDTRFAINYIFSAAAEVIFSSDWDGITEMCGSPGEFKVVAECVCEWCYANNIDPMPFYDACLQLEWHLEATEPEVTYNMVSRAFDRAIWVARRLDPGFIKPVPRQAELPEVKLHPPEIVYKSVGHQVTGDQALAFDAMVKKFPDRVGLTDVIGPHPERKMAKLPAPLGRIVDTNGKGSRLILS